MPWYKKPANIFWMLAAAFVILVAATGIRTAFRGAMFDAEEDRIRRGATY